MRKITQNSVNAFLIGDTFKQQNMSVISTASGKSCLYLHGNLIAVKNMKTGQIVGTLAGWSTGTTRARLHGINILSDSRFTVAKRNNKQVLIDTTDNSRKPYRELLAHEFFDFETGKTVNMENTGEQEIKRLGKDA